MALLSATERTPPSLTPSAWLKKVVPLAGSLVERDSQESHSASVRNSDTRQCWCGLTTLRAERS
jgi:hypothetical protein